MEKELVKYAIEAAKNSYSPYFHFNTGAALLTESNKIYLGCNVENSCGTSNCAERTAIFKAVSDGERKFKAIAIVGGSNGDFKEFITPCGMCRQVMAEFCDKDFKIILGNKNLEYKVYTFDELLPHSFELGE